MATTTLFVNTCIDATSQPTHLVPWKEEIVGVIHADRIRLVRYTQSTRVEKVKELYGFERTLLAVWHAAAYPVIDIARWSPYKDKRVLYLTLVAMDVRAVLSSCSASKQ